MENMDRLTERKTLRDLIESKEVVLDQVAEGDKEAFLATFGDEDAEAFLPLINRLKFDRLLKEAELDHISELLNQAPEDMDWLWESLIPQGRFVGLSGYMKTGKSTLVGEIVAAVLKGRPFLGFPVKQGPVLYLTAEEDRIDVVKRLADFGVTEDDPLWVKGRAMASPPLYQQLGKLITLSDARLLAIDAFSTFTLVEDENDAPTVTRVMHYMLELARKTGVTVLLVHHDRKSSGEGGRVMRGSGQIFGNLDQALFLSRPEGRGDNDRFLKVQGRYQDFAPGTLCLSYRDGRYTFQGLQGERTLDARMRRVWDILTEPMTADQIGEAANLTPSITRHVLKVMVEEGRVKRIGAGKRNDPFRYERVGQEYTIRKN